MRDSDGRVRILRVEFLEQIFANLIIRNLASGNVGPARQRNRLLRADHFRFFPALKPGTIYDILPITRRLQEARHCYVEPFFVSSTLSRQDGACRIWRILDYLTRTL